MLSFRGQGASPSSPLPPFGLYWFYLLQIPAESAGTDLSFQLKILSPQPPPSYVLFTRKLCFLGGIQYINKGVYLSRLPSSIKFHHPEWILCTHSAGTPFPNTWLPPGCFLWLYSCWFCRCYISGITCCVASCTCAVYPNFSHMRSALHSFSWLRKIPFLRSFSFSL